jgi:hypothetical protein
MYEKKLVANGPAGELVKPSLFSRQIPDSDGGLSYLK